VSDTTDSREITLHGGATHPQREAPPSLGQISVFLEGTLLRTLPLNVPVVTIGRTPANVLPLPHPAISRAHAELRVTPEAVILTDTGSANGTFVNGVRLAPQQPVQLAPGSEIQLGPFVLRYEAEVPSAPSADVPSEAHDGSVAEAVAATPMAMPPAVFVPARPPRATLTVPPPTDTVSSYLDFLPVIFADGDFLGRFLLIFQSIWEPLEYRQDHMDMYFDPLTAPEPFLRWLAEWLGVAVTGVSEEGRLRMLLGEAVELYRWRGTRYGLTRMIEVCTGLTPIVAESPSNPAILRIRVQVPAEANVDRDTIERLVKVNKPAHTGYILELVA
jgi:phage tail-like protein